MGTTRLETPRDLVRAVLRAREVGFPLRALHRVACEGTIGELSVGWAITHFEGGADYQFARDYALVEGSPLGFATLGLHALAHSVALADAPPMTLALEDRPIEGYHPCAAIRILPPAGRRPLLRAPRYERQPVARHPWRAGREVDRPALGLARAAGSCCSREDYEKRDVFTIGGTRGGLRALAFLLFDLATDRSFENDVELEGPEGWDNLAVPSCGAKILSPFWDWSSYYKGP
jgi:hypothetical protein